MDWRPCRQSLWSQASQTATARAVPVPPVTTPSGDGVPWAQDWVTLGEPASAVFEDDPWTQEEYWKLGLVSQESSHEFRVDLGVMPKTRQFGLLQSDPVKGPRYKKSGCGSPGG